MTDENARRGKDDEGGSDPDNTVFKKAIDNVFKKVAKRENEDAARRGRRGRTRPDDAGKRQGRRRPGR